jgi:CBS-domain-containing membrane protein
VTCALKDDAAEIARRVAGSPYGYAVVVSDTDVVLGRLRASAVDAAGGATVEQRMEGGPKTMRPDTPAERMLQRLHETGMKSAIVSTPEGRLLGVVSRGDLEARVRPAG